MNKQLDEHLSTLLEQGYILYLKDDKVQTIKAPEYGDVSLHYREGQPFILTLKTTEKA